MDEDDQITLELLEDSDRLERICKDPASSADLVSALEKVISAGRSTIREFRIAQFAAARNQASSDRTISDRLE
jgi:hypothetical protein